MSGSLTLYKNNPGDVIEWVDTPETNGEWLFTFDGGATIYNLFADYPEKLSPEQKEVFDRENPEWAKYFQERTKDQ